MTALDKLEASAGRDIEEIPEDALVHDDDPVQHDDYRPKKHQRVINAIPPLITFAAFIGIWYLYSYTRYDNAVQRRNALPYPHEVLTEGFMPLWDPENRNGLRPILGYMVPTIQVTLIGLAIANVLGVSFAIVMNLSIHLERAFFPHEVVLQTVPILAITPLLTQLVGEQLAVRLV